MRHNRHQKFMGASATQFGVLAPKDSWNVSAVRPVLLLAMRKTQSRTGLADGLRQAGYDVCFAETEWELFAAFGQAAFDLILLHVELENVNVFALCTKLRSASSVPIILVAEQKSYNDMVYGLALGADDYVTTPMTFAELDARIRATLRRTGYRKYVHNNSSGSLYTSILLNEIKRTARIRNQEIQLTQIEFGILQYLLNHANMPVPKEKLIEAVWGFHEVEEFNFIEVAIRRLRQKIEANPSRPEYLVTMRGMGYQLNVK